MSLRFFARIFNKLIPFEKDKAAVEHDFNIVLPRLCPACGKVYGKSNIMLSAMEVWISCDCQSSDKIYLLNTSKTSLGARVRGAVAQRAKETKEG